MQESKLATSMRLLLYRVLGVSMMICACSSQAPRAVVTVSTDFTCYLAVGQMRCWGWGVNGFLGSGSTAEVGSAPNQMSVIQPIHFAPSLGKATYASTGSSHTCVLFETGKLACFGIYMFGNLGTGTVANVGCGGSCLSTIQLSGIDFPEPTVLVTFIAAGSYHNCAIFANGKVRWYAETRRKKE